MSEWKKYRKKPVVIEAMRLTQEFVEAHFFDNMPLPRNFWLSGHYHKEDRILHSWGATINTLEGQMRAEEGDYIIRGVKGELYPCKPDIFAATYEEEKGNGK